VSLRRWTASPRRASASLRIRTDALAPPSDATRNRTASLRARGATPRIRTDAVRTSHRHSTSSGCDGRSSRRASPSSRRDDASSRGDGASSSRIGPNTERRAANTHSTSTCCSRRSRCSSRCSSYSSRRGPHFRSLPACPLQPRPEPRSALPSHPMKVREGRCVLARVRTRRARVVSIAVGQWGSEAMRGEGRPRGLGKRGQKNVL
jgi:hypothetical protein